MQPNPGHIGLWPNPDNEPTTDLHLSTSPELGDATLTLGMGWNIHLQPTAAGAAYLRRLAAAATQLAGLIDSDAEVDDGHRVSMVQ